jgi:RHS repeat-associated protein
MTQAALPNGKTVSYGYDALGRRTSRTADGVTTSFLYDGDDVALDRTGTAVTEYLIGPDIDDQLRQSGPAGSLYFLKDHLDSTVALTDAAGTMVERQNYDAFGASAGSTLTRYGFTGRERDPLTGLLHYRAREYDPQQGRFLTEDPLGWQDGPNLYAYVKNSPLNYTDPLGLSAGDFLRGFMDGASVGFLQAAAFAFVFGVLSCATAGTAVAVIVPLLQAYMGAQAAVALAKELADLIKRDMCPEERHYRWGQLIGGAIGGALGGRVGARAGRFCFVAGTLVQTQDGLKPIEEIKSGDKVLSSEPERNEPDKGQWQEVISTSVNVVSEVLEIKAGSEAFIVTPEHPFWMAGEGWTQARNLVCGAELLAKGGKAVRVTSIQRREGRFKVYNFEVANAHTYFVGKTGILVHNDCNINPKKLQHEYKHAPDFGVTGNWNKANAKAFAEAIQNHVRTAPQQTTGTYRGSTPVTHYFDPATRLWVAVDAANNFVAGWKLSPAQVQHLLTSGNVQ